MIVKLTPEEIKKYAFYRDQVVYSKCVYLKVEKLDIFEKIDDEYDLYRLKYDVPLPRLKVIEKLYNVDFSSNYEIYF